jgi:beta-glucosidase
MARTVAALSYLTLMSLACLSGCGGGRPPADEGDVDWPLVTGLVAVDPALEQRVDSILSELTLEQKVGQMVQAEIQNVTPADVRDYHLGSILNGGGSYPNRSKASGVADWLALADAFYDASMDTSLGGAAIPATTSPAPPCFRTTSAWARPATRS